MARTSAQTKSKKIYYPSFSGGILTTGSAPSVAAGTGAGTGGTVSVSGNDIAGVITVNAGTTPAASSIIVTITFSATLQSAPKSVIVTAANTNNQIGRIFTDPGGSPTASWLLRSTGTALTASQTYLLNYLVIL